MSAHVSSKRRRIAALITVAVVAMAAFAPSASAATAKEKALRRMINDYRADKGRSRLKMADKLVSFAHKQAKKMAEDGRFDQDPAGGWDHSTQTQLETYAEKAGCDTAPFLAEIIASTVGTGDHSLNELMRQWKASDTHDAAMLNRKWEKMGTGVFVDDDGSLWAVALFCSTQR